MVCTDQRRFNIALVSLEGAVGLSPVKHSFSFGRVTDCFGTSEQPQCIFLSLAVH